MNTSEASEACIFCGVPHRPGQGPGRVKAYLDPDPHDFCAFCGQSIICEHDAIAIPFLVDDLTHPLFAARGRHVHRACVLVGDRMQMIEKAVEELTRPGRLNRAYLFDFARAFQEVQALGDDAVQLRAVLKRCRKELTRPDRLVGEYPLNLLQELEDVKLLGEDVTHLGILLQRCGKDPEVTKLVSGDTSAGKRLVEKLVRLLRRTKDPILKMRIVELLACPAAKGVATSPLLDELVSLFPHRGEPYQREFPDGSVGIVRDYFQPCNHLRNALGKTLTVLVGQGDLRRIRELLEDRHRPREVRLILARLVAIIPGVAAEDALIEMIDDTEIARIAFEAIGSRGIHRARDVIQHQAKHEREWRREEARKALAVMDSKPVPGRARPRPRGRSAGSGRPKRGL